MRWVRNPSNNYNRFYVFAERDAVDFALCWIGYQTEQGLKHLFWAEQSWSVLRILRWLRTLKMPFVFELMHWKKVCYWTRKWQGNLGKHHYLSSGRSALINYVLLDWCFFYSKALMRCCAKTMTVQRKLHSIVLRMISIFRRMLTLVSECRIPLFYWTFAMLSFALQKLSSLHVNGFVRKLFALRR